MPKNSALKPLNANNLDIFIAKFIYEVDPSIQFIIFVCKLTLSICALNRELEYTTPLSNRSQVCTTGLFPSK